MSRRSLAVLATVGLLLLAACGSPSAARSNAPGQPQAVPTTTGAPGGAAPSTTAPAPATSTTAPPPSTTTTAAPAGPPWNVLSTDAAGVAVEERNFTAPSGRVVTLVRFDAGATVFDLHIGSTDPPADLAALPPDRGPALAADETPFLLAAFNGGFKMNTGQGGVEEEGQVVAPLVAGMASFVVDTNGSAHIGVWGSQLPTPGESVSSVRQNQPPLITNGVASPTVNDPGAWGLTIDSSMVVARSAVGEDAQGNIVYAGGMDLVPADLSAALLNAGAVNAMQLDINPEWVQLDTTPAPGASLVAQIPGQNRPADQYVAGWTRDFFAVLAPTTVPPRRPR